MTNKSEEELLSLCRNGNNAAMETMLDRYKYLVRGKANALYLVGADKDDLIQEGMIGLFKALREYDPKKNDSFAAFAQLCISRQMYTAVKLSQRKKNWPLNDYISFDGFFGGEDQNEDKKSKKSVYPADTKTNPEESLIDREQAVLLEERITALLSDMEKKVLGYYTQGISCNEIARRMKKDPKSIDNALQRLRRKLKTVLAINS